MSINSTMLWRRLPSPSTTPNELLEILTAHNGGYYVLPVEPYDEVYPGIYLGDSTTALCLHLLKRLQVTHVLNTAWGKQRNLGMVNTSAGYYRSVNFEFMGVEALDIAVFPLFHYFFECANFIDRALQKSEKVLVHCGEGISRSSTTVIAYLMIKEGMDVKEAVRTVVKHRNILPNQGFLLQLCQLNDQLKTATKEQREGTMSPTDSIRQSSISPITFSAGVRNEYRQVVQPSKLTQSTTPIYLSPSNYNSSPYRSRVSRSPSPFRSKYHSSELTTYTDRTVRAKSPVSNRFRSQSIERSVPSTFKSVMHKYSSSPLSSGTNSSYRPTLMSTYLNRSNSSFR